MAVKLASTAFVIFSLAFTGPAFTQACDSDSAWQRVRAAYPIHSQTLAQCVDAAVGRVVIVLTEPPPHITTAATPAIVKALLPLPESAIRSVHRKRHRLGFDGWAEDLVIVLNAQMPQQQAAVDDSLAVLATLAFGSSYKAEVEDITLLLPQQARQAPKAVEVTKEELHSWLLGPRAHKLVPIDGGSGSLLRDLTNRNVFGTFYGEEAGLVVAIVPRGPVGLLNHHVDSVRQFAVDSDTFLGAIKVDDAHVALVGRERTSRLSDAPPLRLETILLLASERGVQLSQSYERRRAFAGKLLGGAGELFGWDWAPILLSDEIIDTEFGSLLNFTDNMLKGWSESGTISYVGFTHKGPSTFPFGSAGAIQTIGTKRLTYNWNTAGVGIVSAMDGTEIFALRNTGSLPVSYFPEGSEDDPSTKAKLLEAEDRAYAYFRTLRNPLLTRAAQYSALYQAFLAFDVRAARPQGAAPKSATMSTVERVLAQNVNAALRELSSPQAVANREFLLQLAFQMIGAEAQRLESTPLPLEQQKRLEIFLKELASNVAELDRDFGPEWRSLFATMLAAGQPIAPKFKQRLETIAEGLSLVHPPETVRRAVVSASEHVPDGWLRTPSIVVSKGEKRAFTGGHNIGGKATRVELDASVPKGDVRVSGSYEGGRVLRLNPADRDAERDAVRLLDREVGLHDANQQRGAQAVKDKLLSAPIPTRPVRVVSEALEVPAVRSTRGAMPEPAARQIGFRPEEVNLASYPEIDAIIRQTGTDVMVAPVPRGFLIIRPRPAPPKAVTAPNPTSMHEAVNLAVKQISLGPPLMLHPKIAFHGIERTDAIRHVHTMIQKGEAVAGAGGKPPFGGNRPLFGLDELPEPNRRFTYTMAGRDQPIRPRDTTFTERTWDSLLGLVGKRRERVYSASAGAQAEFSMRPNWSEASFRFPSPDTVQIVGLPSGHMHIVEVTVPVIVESRSQSMLMRAISWFKEAPSAAKAENINKALQPLFKEAGTVNIEEALIQYKSLMIEKFGSTDVHMNLHREGRDIVVTDVVQPDARFRG